jgi:hypothetical protein
MWESVETSPALWILGLAFVAFILTVIGFLSSSKLTPELRKKRVRKFALIGAGIFFLGVTIFKPFVYSSSNAKYLDKIEVGELATSEQSGKLETNQTEQIERMKEDIIDLRKDIHKMNMFYSTVIQVLANILAGICFAFAFSKEKNPADDAE